MKDDPVSAVSFVQCVEQFPCLWNCSLKEYCKKDERDKAWKAISEEIKDTDSNCRERWNNIRCAFVRSQRPLPTGSGTKGKRPYYLFRHLQFLLPYTKGKAGGRNRYTSDVSHTSHEAEEPTADEQATKPSCTRKIQDLDQSPTSSITDKKVVCKEKRLPTKRSPLEHKNDADSAIMQWTDTKNNKHTDDDANLLFFRSLLPDMKRLTEKKRRKFMKNVIDILDSLLEDDTSQPTASCPTASASPST